MDGLSVAAAVITLLVAGVTLWLDDHARQRSKHWLLTQGFGKRL
jgi:hypothetical protein